jgi:hypothetical protein
VIRMDLRKGTWQGGRMISCDDGEAEYSNGLIVRGRFVDGKPSGWCDVTNKKDGTTQKINYQYS